MVCYGDGKDLGFLNVCRNLLSEYALRWRIVLAVTIRSRKFPNPVDSACLGGGVGVGSSTLCVLLCNAHTLQSVLLIASFLSMDFCSLPG